MTDLLSGLEAPSDAELISRVRGGDVASYGELFSRHVDAANRLARQLVRGPDVDDLVSEAFAKVLSVLQGGGGPDVAFRAYLLTSVRRLHVDKIRHGSKLQTSDDMEQFDPGIPFQDTAVAAFDNGAAAKAFASLPERWQLVLWHLEVEGQKPADIAPLLGMSANSVSALAYRAREGLRQAFLTMHLSEISAERCRWVNEHLGAYVRRGLSRRDTVKVEEHLDECRRCTAMYLELTEVNSNLAGIIAPLLLGAAAAGYISSTGAAGATGLFAVAGRVRDVIAGNAGAATAGAVAAGVAAVATAGIVIGNLSGPDPKDVIVGADEPFVAVQPPSGSSGSKNLDEKSPSKQATKEPRSTGSIPLSVIPTELGGTATVAGTEPGTTDPTTDATTDPGTVTDPGTGTATDPGTVTDPGTGSTPGTSPGNSPGTSPGTSPAQTPSPTTTQTASPPTGGQADLSITVANVVGADLTIDLTGNPTLPASIEVGLTSPTGQVTFAPLSGTCVRTTPTTALCQTAPPLAARVASVALPGLVSYQAVLPLDLTQLQATETVTVSVSSPDATDPFPGDNSFDVTVDPLPTTTPTLPTPTLPTPTVTITPTVTTTPSPTLTTTPSPTLTTTPSPTTTPTVTPPEPITSTPLAVVNTGGANVQATILVSDIPAEATHLYFTLGAQHTALTGGAPGCDPEEFLPAGATDGQKKVRVRCAVNPVIDTAIVTLDLKQPVGQTPEGEMVTLTVSTIDFDAPGATSTSFMVNTNKK